MKEYTGSFQGAGLRFGIVISRFNEVISKRLLEGALDGLKRHGVKDGDIDLAWVPGAFEIPLIARKLAQTNQYDAILCLGAIIRGATPHFDFVASQTASGISQVSLQFEIPILFGVLTTDTVEQAIERAGCKCGNKGFDIAVGAIEMANLIKTIGKIK